MSTPAAPYGGDSDAQAAVEEFLLRSEGGGEAPEEGAQVAETAEAEQTETGLEASEDLAAIVDGEKPAVTEGEDEGVETLDELAVAMGVEPEALQEHLHVTMEDGTSVPLKSILDTYRANPAAAEALAGAEESRRAYDARQSELMGEHDQRIAQMGELTNALMEQLDLEDASTNWAELEQMDPDAWMRARMKRDDKQKVIQKSIEGFRQEQARREQEFAKQRNNFRRSEQLKLVDKMPQWKDNMQRAKDLTDISGYLIRQGFDEKQIEGIDDHRMLLIVFNAMKYERANAVTEKALPKLRKLPRVPTLKGQARVDAPVVPDGEKKLDDAFARLGKTGNIDDAAELMAGFLEEG